jgi:hypothetical protein
MGAVTYSGSGELQVASIVVFASWIQMSAFTQLIDRRRGLNNT